MHVGYGEIVRGAIEAIRMVGFPFGHADDCAESFVWTQAVLERGYDLLRLADAQRPAGGWAKPGTGRDLEPDSVDLGGLPLFAYAARLADLAGTAVRGPKRVGAITAYGAFGGMAAPYIAFRAARSGCAAAVLWQPASQKIAGDAPATLVMASPAGPGAVNPIFVTPRSTFSVEATTAEPAALIPAELAAKAAKSLAARDNRSALVVLAADPQYAGAKLGPAALAEAAGWPKPGDAERGSFDPQARLRQVIDRGYETDDANHQFFVGLLGRIRLPNTERSANQAG